MIDVKLIKALAWVITARTLKINQRQKRMVNDSKGIGIIEMSPMDFLRLTTPSKSYIDSIFQLAKPLDFYNSPETQKDQGVHPYLEFDRETGKIQSHEGRHRAAAVYKAGGKKFPVALFPTPKHRQNSLEELPTVLTGQFNTYTISIDYAEDIIEWTMGNFEGHEVV